MSSFEMGTLIDRILKRPGKKNQPIEMLFGNVNGKSCNHFWTPRSAVIGAWWKNLVLVIFTMHDRLWQEVIRPALIARLVHALVEELVTDYTN